MHRTNQAGLRCRESDEYSPRTEEKNVFSQPETAKTRDHARPHRRRTHDRHQAQHRYTFECRSDRKYPRPECAPTGFAVGNTARGPVGQEWPPHKPSRPETQTRQTSARSHLVV